MAFSGVTPDLFGIFKTVFRRSFLLVFLFIRFGLKTIKCTQKQHALVIFGGLFKIGCLGCTLSTNSGRTHLCHGLELGCLVRPASQPDFTSVFRSSGGVQGPRGRTDAHRLAHAQCRWTLLHHHEVPTSVVHVTPSIVAMSQQSRLRLHWVFVVTVKQDLCVCLTCSSIV